MMFLKYRYPFIYSPGLDEVHRVVELGRVQLLGLRDQEEEEHAGGESDARELQHRPPDHRVAEHGPAGGEEGLPGPVQTATSCKTTFLGACSNQCLPQNL